MLRPETRQRTSHRAPRGARATLSRSRSHRRRRASFLRPQRRVPLLATENPTLAIAPRTASRRGPPRCPVPGWLLGPGVAVPAPPGSPARHRRARIRPPQARLLFLRQPPTAGARGSIPRWLDRRGAAARPTGPASRSPPRRRHPPQGWQPAPGSRRRAQQGGSCTRTPRKPPHPGRAVGLWPPRSGARFSRPPESWGRTAARAPPLPRRAPWPAAPPCTGPVPPRATRAPLPRRPPCSGAPSRRRAVSRVPRRWRPPADCKLEGGVADHSRGENQLHLPLAVLRDEEGLRELHPFYGMRPRAVDLRRGAQGHLQVGRRRQHSGPLHPMVAKVREQVGAELHLPEVCPWIGCRPEVRPEQVSLPVALRDSLFPSVARFCAL